MPATVGQGPPGLLGLESGPEEARLYVHGDGSRDFWFQVPRGPVFHDHIQMRTPEGLGFCRPTLELQGQSLDLDVISRLGRGLGHGPHLIKIGT